MDSPRADVRLEPQGTVHPDWLEPEGANRLSWLEPDGASESRDRLEPDGADMGDFRELKLPGFEKDVPRFCTFGVEVVVGEDERISVAEAFLDSGATHVYRYAQVREYQSAVACDIMLPVGLSVGRMSSKGSLLSMDTKPAVIPLGKVVEVLGCEVRWDFQGPLVKHPLRGLLGVRTVHGRMVLGVADARALVDELETAWELGVTREDPSPSLRVVESAGSQGQPCVSVRFLKAEENTLGLIDGGATNALRQGSAKELQQASVVKVELAAGQTELRMNEQGTLLTAHRVTPILPLGPAIECLGMVLEWSTEGIRLTHPTRGELPVTLVKGCPMIAQELLMDLILELEDKIRVRELRVKAMQLSESPDFEIQGSLKEALNACRGDAKKESVVLAAYAKKIFPEVPHDILQQVAPLQVNPETNDAQTTGLNRRARRRLKKAQRVLVHLCSGQQSWKAKHDEAFLEVELNRGRDLFNESLHSYVLQEILSGKVKGILGGPPCRTMSRSRARSPGPRVLRARHGIERFGLEGLTGKERTLAIRDTVLILRMLFLMHVTQEVQEGNAYLGFEHPRDPAELDPSPEAQALPSLWEWPEIKGLGLYKVRFDQGALGHDHVKPSVFATSSWMVAEELSDKVVPPTARWISTSSDTESLRERMERTSKASKWRRDWYPFFSEGGSCGLVAEKKM